MPARSEPVWVGKNGLTRNADAVIAEIKRAGDWGLDAAAFDHSASDPDTPSEKARAEAELGLSLAVLKYARYARGGRIEDPATQLSSYLDRKPQLRPPFLVMTDIAAADAPDDYLRKLHPQHEQFEKLRQQYLARRDGAPQQRRGIPAKGNKLYPGNAQPGHRACPRASAGARLPTASPNVYDDALVEAVKAFQTKRDISPANGIINAKTRRAFNEGKEVSPSTLLANMEEWRWMPRISVQPTSWSTFPSTRCASSTTGRSSTPSASSSASSTSRRRSSRRIWRRSTSTRAGTCPRASR